MALESKIALLIDCDNVSHRSVEGVIDELSKYGKVNIRNAYGNWKNENMKGWEVYAPDWGCAQWTQMDHGWEVADLRYLFGTACGSRASPKISAW